jgi:hypothetical protein
VQGWEQWYETAPRNQRNHRGFGTSDPSGSVVDLPIHCNLIQTHCNAIQTLLQLNSNNSTQCGEPFYFAVASFRERWRDMASFRGSNCTQVRRNSDLLVRN